MDAINPLPQISFCAFGTFHDERTNPGFHNHVFFAAEHGFLWRHFTFLCFDGRLRA